MPMNSGFSSKIKRLKRWMISWTNPLNIAKQMLWKEIKKKSHFARGRILDIGCGEMPYRGLFCNIDQYICFDIEPYPGVDIVGTGIALPFAENVIDTIFASQVLEHVQEPSIFIAEARRVLKPGGILLTAPQTWGLHLEPHDFYRYTSYGLHYLAEKSKLEVLEIEPTCGLWATLTQRLLDTVINKYAVRRSRRTIRLLSFILAPVQMVGYYLDCLVGKQGDTLDYVLVAKKPLGNSKGFHDVTK